MWECNFNIYKISHLIFTKKLFLVTLGNEGNPNAVCVVDKAAILTPSGFWGERRPWFSGLAAVIWLWVRSRHGGSKRRFQWRRFRRALHPDRFSCVKPFIYPVNLVLAFRSLSSFLFYLIFLLATSFFHLHLLLFWVVNHGLLHRFL